jgi:hypothetical protein
VIAAEVGGAAGGSARLGGSTSEALPGSPGGSESLMTASAEGLNSGAPTRASNSPIGRIRGTATGAAGSSTGFDATTSQDLGGAGGASASGGR